MFNPFNLLTPRLLNAMVIRGKKYFVRQTFIRGRNHLDQGVVGYFILSHYDNFTTAQDHFGAIAYDPNRFLYDWENEEHRERLMVAAEGPAGYRIFSCVFKKDWEKGVTDPLREKIRQYVKKIGWKPAREDGLTTNYELQFGELYIRIKYAGREVKVKFDDIEKL